MLSKSVEQETTAYKTVFLYSNHLYHEYSNFTRLKLQYYQQLKSSKNDISINLFVKIHSSRNVLPETIGNGEKDDFREIKSRFFKPFPPKIRTNKNAESHRLPVWYLENMANPVNTPTTIIHPCSLLDIVSAVRLR